MSNNPYIYQVQQQWRESLAQNILESNKRFEELLAQFNVNVNGQQGIGSQKIGGQPGQKLPFTNLAELNAHLTAQRKAQEAAKPKPVDKPARIKEIENELDIIRGVVPTPKGYKIDTASVKSLRAELKELQT